MNFCDCFKKIFWPFIVRITGKQFFFLTEAYIGNDGGYYNSSLSTAFSAEACYREQPADCGLSLIRIRKAPCCWGKP